ncbi:MAG: alpha/beta fold hydrolase, partial [Desulfovibrio sp.]|nr:alpha/beta fold hydrolase [Desulfovibrio sp.]
MPYLETSPYRAPLWLPGGQVQTIFSSLFRTVPVPPFERFRLATPDGDFILADRLRAAHNPDKTVVVLSHGLEGNSRRKYMRGMCLAFQALGWDCLSRNFRTCGGEINGTPGMYHSGQTEDLHCVVDFCVSEGYRRILLVGFSMGGNQTLKYLGEEPERVPPQVAGAAVFSVPCDLTGAARALDRPANAVYRRYFMRTLRRKIRAKHLLYPDLYPLDGLDDMRTFAAFDNAYTAPLHAFASAADYWSKASCLPHL